MDNTLEMTGIDGSHARNDKSADPSVAVAFAPAALGMTRLVVAPIVFFEETRQFVSFVNPPETHSQKQT